MQEQGKKKNKNGTMLAVRVLCASGRCGPPDPTLTPPEALRGDVDPEPAQQRPVHPGPGVHFPAALRQQQWHSESSQDQQGRQGSAEAERRHSALPGEPAQLLRVLRFIEALQQPAKIR